MLLQGKTHTSQVKLFFSKIALSESESDYAFD